MAEVLALAGFMGSGKSAVGAALAHRLGRRFIDLDSEVERSLGKSIAEHFRTAGEKAFRAEETAVLGEVLAREGSKDVVLSLGGGTLEAARNRDSIRRAGSVVFLDVSSERAWRRVVGTGRPLAADETAFAELLARRRLNYEDSADWVVPTDTRSIDEIVDDIDCIVRWGGGALEGLWGRRLGGTQRPSVVAGGERALDYLGHRVSEVSESGMTFHVFTDTNVMQAWGDRVTPIFGASTENSVHVIEAGERSKCAGVLETCWEWLAERNAKRDDIVVALGGGVVGDLAGLVAATYHRGIGLWQMPTSLLAQVDSSVGGKTAINLRVAKNLVGAFYQPDQVIVEPSFLCTLPEVEYVGALGEVVKHALLMSDEALAWLEERVDEIAGRDEGVLSDLVKRNIWYKASVVEEDEKEAGKRAVLNLGHTTAHALEASLGYGALTHGQAVGLGLLVALVLSEELLGLAPGVRQRTHDLLVRLGLETTVEIPRMESMLEAATHDKKSKPGNQGFVGLRSLGEPVWGLDVGGEVFERALAVIGR